jgi:SAM-dependent methyltransferase
MATENENASETNSNVTRGSGLLEAWLAKKRSVRANRLIPAQLRSGRILDIGCGSHPYFLANTEFREKYSIDQIAMPPEIAARHGIRHRTCNLNEDPRLPFDGCFFNAITLLAVVEHLNPDIAIQIFSEMHRMLCPGGVAVVTTPASWSDGLLHAMARIGLVSSEEIHEHAFAYSLPLLGACLGKAGFGIRKLKFGYFEGWLNLWASAEKD